MSPSFSSPISPLYLFSSTFDLYLYTDSLRARRLAPPVACLLLVSFPFVLLPLCLIISVDSHPHC